MPILITVLPDNLPAESLDKIITAFHSAAKATGLCSDSILVSPAERKRTVDDLLGDAGIIHHPYKTVSF